MGFETEFLLLSSTAPPTLPNNHGYSSSLALPPSSNLSSCLEEIASHIMDPATGIELETYHSEAAPGQYEIVTGPMPPMEAVDALVWTRECIVGVASKWGFRATMSPRVFSTEVGSSAHAHISLQYSGSSATEADMTELTPHEAQFISSLVEHLPSLSLFAQPQPVSYARVEDGAHAAGTWVAWGVENKEVPVRVCALKPKPQGEHAKKLCTSGGIRSVNFEIRFVDGLANVSLVFSNAKTHANFVNAAVPCYGVHPGGWNPLIPTQPDDAYRRYHAEESHVWPGIRADAGEEAGDGDRFESAAGLRRGAPGVRGVLA